MISGLPESTLRYYEQIGIIAPIARDPSSGHRAYTDEDIQSLVTISCLSATGMPLDAMREYLKNRFDGTEGARRQMALLDAQALRLAAKAESIRMQQAYVYCKLYMSFWLSFYIFLNVRKALFYRLYGHFAFVVNLTYLGLSSYIFAINRG